MYGEDFVRIGNDGRSYSSRRPGEAWTALAEFAKRFMEDYYPEEHMRRVSEWDRYDNEFARYRGQPRTRTGRFKKMRYMRRGRECHEDIEQCKEMVGGMLAETYGEDWIIEKAIKEASEFIEAAVKGDDYEMFKEFAELCILMKGAAEFIPEDLEEEACRKALEYYARKSEHARYSNPLLDEYYRMSRSY